MRTHLRTRVVCLALAFAAAASFSNQANAQETSGFELGGFRPAERGSSWFALDSLDFRGRLRPAAGLVGDWTNKPLVIRNADGSERANVVENQFIVHAGGSLVVAERFRFGLDLPFVPYQSGDGGSAAGATFAAPSSSGIGDLRTSADARIVGKYGSAFTSAIGFELYLPTGSSSAYSGDHSVRVIPRVLAAGEIGKFVYAGRLGIHLKPAGSFDGNDLGSEFVFGASAGVRATSRIVVGPEVFGSTVMNSNDGWFSARGTPIEVLLGSHLDVIKDVRAGVGVGTGVTRGFGSPQAIGLLSLEWTPGVTAPSPPSKQEELVDLVPIPPPHDRDGDGIRDYADACPTMPGGANANPVLNGCPPPDADADAVLDADDACPDEPGPANEDPAMNGCPKAIVAGGQIRIREPVKFRFGSADLDPTGDGVLFAIRKVLGEHTELARVRIDGHTDAVGNTEHNARLSLARAASVRTWLVEHGIKAERLETKGFGSTQPIVGNDTDEGRRENRRVEFHILDSSVGGSR